jgi:hypothetical protein
MRGVLLVVAAAVGVGVVLNLPTALHLGASLPRTPFSEGHAIAAGLVASSPGELLAAHTARLGWPGGADFRPLLWPLAILAMAVGPVSAAGLGFVLAPAFNAVCGAILGRASGCSPAGTALLAGATALSPWVVNTLANGQLEQAVVGGAALIWAAGAVARGAGVVLTGVTVAAVGFAAPHVALAGCLGLPAWVRRDRHGAAALLAALVGALLVHRWVAGNFTEGAHLFAPKGASGRPSDLLAETAGLRALLLPARGSGEVWHAPWIGWALPAAALFGRDRRGLASAAVLLAAACAPLPLPGGSAYRMVAGVPVALAAAAAPFASGRVLLAVGAAVAVESLALTGRTLPVPATQVSLERDSALAAASGPILDLPLAGTTCAPGAAFHYALQVADHGRPVPLLLPWGRPAYRDAPPTVRSLGKRLSSCSGVADALRDAGMATVVLHTHDCPPAEAAACLTRELGPAREGPGTLAWELR